MRKRTEARSDTILKAAADLFCSRGYDQTSMDEIADKLQMSKRTVYDYFKSKENLFIESMLYKIHKGTTNVKKILDTDASDIRDTLERFADAYLKNISTARAIDVIRTIISVSHRHRNISTRLINAGPESDWAAVALLFDKAKALGTLRNVDSALLAQHFKGLVESGVVDALLYNTKPWADLAQAPAQAVDAFLRAYGMEPGDRSD